MRLGLEKFDLNYILDTIKKFSEIEKAVIFGSRAKGNYKPGSDVDIAVYGEKINFDTISALHSLLEEHGPLPYFFDVVDYTHLNSQELKAHIDRVGVVIFSKEDDLPTKL